MSEERPIVEPLSSPRGVPLTVWRDLDERLEAGDTYLLGTVGSNARPHLVPVLGVWLEGKLYFNARGSTRKAQHLEHNPHCVVAVGDETFDLVVDGKATVVADEATLRRVAGAFQAKYPWWQPNVRGVVFYPDGLDEPESNVYEVSPDVVIGFGKERGFSATRWRY